MPFPVLTRSALIALALATAGLAPARAQDSGTGEMAGMDHSGHDMAATDGSDSPATLAFKAANAAMHDGMALDFTGNADVDFISGMIPHHQGAVEMAKIVLEHGEDPEVRKLAEGIIAAQEAEIAWMQAWLAEHAPAAE